MGVSDRNPRSYVVFSLSAFFVFGLSDALEAVVLLTGAVLRLYVRVGLVIVGAPKDVEDGAEYCKGAGFGCTVS